MRLVPNKRTVARVYHVGLGAAVVSVRQARAIGQWAQDHTERTVERWNLRFTHLSEEGRITTERVLEETADSAVGKQYLELRHQLDDRLSSWREQLGPREWATKNADFATARKPAAKKTAVRPAQGGVILDGP